MQRQVVAVGIELRLIERVDDDVAAQSLANGLAGENHGEVETGSGWFSVGGHAELYEFGVAADARRINVHANFGTKLIHRTLGALRLARDANLPAVVDHAWAKSTHSFCGTICIRSCSIFIGVGVLGEAQPSAEPRHVRIDDDAGRQAEGGAQHDVRRLAADARQRDQLRPCRAALRRRVAP